MPRKANLTSVASALTAAPGFNPCQYKLRHSGDQDPTSQEWRDNHAPASYQWIPYRGILVDEGDPITSMNGMFRNNETFNDPDIGNWHTSSVTDMSYMFYGTSSFNQDLTGWNVSSVTNYADFATGGNSSWTLKPTKNVQTSGSFTFSAVQWETTNNNSTTRYISWPLFSTTAAVSDVNSISVSNISQTQPTSAGTAQTFTLQNSTNGAPTQQVYTISSSDTPPASSFYSGSVLPYIISNGVSLYMVMKLDTTATQYTTYQQYNGFFYQTMYRYTHQAIQLNGDFDIDYNVTF